MTEFRSCPLVILGAGYTGKFLYPLAKANAWQTYATSRNPTIHLTHIPEKDRLTFDLLDPESWNHIPPNAHLVWCFPALPEQTVIEFLSMHSHERGRLIILGSTSAYGSGQHTLVDEHTAIDDSLPRVQCEEFLRKRYGAIILRLAGLYGPGRHVLDWMRKGKITHTNKFVNLIHIEDVAAICLAALERGDDGEVYIVSDGMPRQWSEIFSVAKKRWAIACPPLSTPQNPGKRLNTQKLRDRLYPSFLHPNLYEALDHIEKHKS